MIDRRIFLGSLAALGFSAPFAGATQSSGTDADLGISYLESLGQPGALNPKVAYIPPSRIDPLYSHVVYVNAAASGPAAQRMWVLERSGADWQVALWDQDYWAEKGVTERPPYSWPVSTGRKYRGEKRSGPTPLGIFNADDRSHRHRKGWGSPGMYNSIYIDLHYSGGRASGVAIHGTTRNQYRKLGRIDSHGCVRMHQSNADQLWNVFHAGGKRAAGENSPIWSEVPRYFKSTPKRDSSTRWNYVRDGSFLYDENGERLTKPGYSALFVFYRDDI